MTARLDLAALMAVEPSSSEHEFVGLPENYGGLGIYGGHFLGQGLAAAYRTVERPQVAHSIHAHFLQKGDPDTELRYSVTTLSNRSSGGTRTVTASQDGNVKFHMVAAFKVPGTGDQHQPVAPEVRDVDELIAERRAAGQDPLPFPFLAGRADYELIGEPFFDHDPERPPALRGWTRAVHDRPLDERERQIVIAYLSDSTLMFNALLPHGAPFQTHQLTSLDHAIWFHRDADPTQWMLFDQRSSAANDGRGMNTGDLFTRTGELIATCAQESLLRTISPTPTPMANP